MPDLSVYKQEITDTLQKLLKTMPVYEELQFFAEMVISHYLVDFEKTSRRIVVIGSNIPEELVFAAGAAPYWILGGSRASETWADDIVPRDTDPVSRSSLGYILSGFAGESLILIPLVSDSTRKLAYILKARGFHVHTFHFPPVKDRQSFEEWNRQYEACRDAVSLYFKKPLTKYALRKSQEQIVQVKNRIQDFMEVSEGVLNGTGRMFILGSYYCADNLSEWGFRLECLTEKFRKANRRQNNGKGRVLLLGSPVYFPNYKVPFLIEESGLEIFMQADYTSLSLQSRIRRERMPGERAEDVFYREDLSSAYVKNGSLYERIAGLLLEKEIDGVVYHVLKGQIEYDFELGRFEELFEKMNIPVFRLETDYNYQDIEQLRIRLEAFSEILQQRKYRKAGEAI